MRIKVNLLVYIDKDKSYTLTNEENIPLTQKQ